MRQTWTLPNLPQLDIRTLKRQGALPSGSVRLATRREELRLYVELVEGALSIHSRDGSATIRLTHTACNYGGTRPWFCCPRCKRRVAIVYLRGSWMCRQCTGLLYECQLESDLHRMIRKARKLRIRLGGPAALTAAFPLKPPRMHRRTYERLRLQSLLLETQISGAVAAWGRAQQRGLRRPSGKCGCSHGHLQRTR